MKEKKTLVFGASVNPDRYSYKAIKMLGDYGYEISAIGGRPGHLGDVEILVGHPEIADIHTVTMYMGKARQEEHEDYILSLEPKRLIFNPGAENTSLFTKAKNKGIDVVNACTLVMLRTNQY